MIELGLNVFKLQGADDEEDDLNTMNASNAGHYFDNEFNLALMDKSNEELLNV